MKPATKHHVKSDTIEKVGSTKWQNMCLLRVLQCAQEDLNMLKNFFIIPALTAQETQYKNNENN